MRRFATSVLVLALPVAAVAAQTPLVAQPAGLASPSRLLDFGAGLFPDGTPVTTAFAGLVFTRASYVTTASPINNVVGGHLVADSTAGPPATLRIRFAQPIADVSFVYHQLGRQAQSTFRAMLQGVVVDSFAILWDDVQPNNFFGWTETLLDEVQIDFVGDFRLDSLAFDPVGGASCHPFNGNNVNPAGFGCVTLPVLGSTWQATVFATPDTVLTALVHAPAGFAAPVPLFGGELLLDTTQPLTAFLGHANHAMAVPAASSWIGTRLVFQAVRLDVVGGTPTLVPLNGMMLIVGL